MRKRQQQRHHDWPALKADFLASPHRSVKAWGEAHGFKHVDTNFQRHTKGWAKEREKLRLRAVDMAMEAAAHEAGKALAPMLEAITRKAACALELGLDRTVRQLVDDEEHRLDTSELSALSLILFRQKTAIDQDGASPREVLVTVTPSLAATKKKPDCNAKP